MEPTKKLASKNAFIGILIAIIAILAFMLLSNTSHAPETTTTVDETGDEAVEETSSETEEETETVVAETSPATSPAPVTNTQPAPVATTPAPTVTKTVAPFNAVLLAENETGNHVTISYASLTQPGYVVIHKIDNNNNAKLVGHTDLLPTGTSYSITTQISPMATQKTTLTATLVADNGDGVFEFPGADYYLKNSDGNIVSDVDVVDVRPEREDVELNQTVKKYLE